MAETPAPNGKPELSTIGSPAPAKTVEGLRFELDPGVDDGEYLVVAFVGDEQVGWLEVQTDWVPETDGWAPLIESVEVEEDWRRRGIATGMLSFLERETGVRPHHNWSDISADGEAWANATSDRTPGINV